jgi:hypothetical protein
MQYYYAYLNKKTNRLSISAIVDKSDDMIQLMNSNILGNVKTFCIAFILGSQYGNGGWKIENKIEEFSDNVTFFNG